MDVFSPMTCLQASVHQQCAQFKMTEESSDIIYNLVDTPPLMHGNSYMTQNAGVPLSFGNLVPSNSSIKKIRLIFHASGIQICRNALNTNTPDPSYKVSSRALLVIDRPLLKVAEVSLVRSIFSSYFGKEPLNVFEDHTVGGFLSYPFPDQINRESPKNQEGDLNFPDENRLPENEG